MEPTEPLRHAVEKEQAESNLCWKRVAAVSVVVFAAAIILRMPSCYQSFWLDELHSAWSVWGDLGDVMSRADRGHQSPLYFFGLWFWKQIVGESELALRMSSVLAVAASCVVMTIGVTRWTSSIVAGAAAGLVLAVESNSIFFGTELRPYALVMLFSSLAVVLFLPLVAASARQEHRYIWSAFVAAILLAALSQPTAIGVLAWLPVTLAIVWSYRDPRMLFRFTLRDGLLTLAVAAVGFAVWRVTSQSWQQRSDWASFASATRVGQIWNVWDWTWLLAAPLGLLVVAAAGARLRKESIGNLTVAASWLAIIAVFSTCLFWIVSSFQWVPMWHRRYFIAVLPIFACIAGGSVGAVAGLLPQGWKRTAGASIAAMGLVIGLAHHQRTLERLPNYPVALANRGENWRDAVQWINANASQRDRVYLDSGLIEATAMLYSMPQPFTNAIAPDQREYLSYPVNGPYQIGLPRVELLSGSNTFPRSIPERILLLTRRRAETIATRQSDSRKIGFGNVCVVVIPGNTILPGDPDR